MALEDTDGIPDRWAFQNSLDREKHEWLISLISLVREQVGNDPWYDPQGLAGDKDAQKSRITFFKGIERYTAAYLRQPEDPVLSESAKILQKLVTYDEAGKPQQVPPQEEMFTNVTNPTFKWDQYPPNPSWNAVVRHIMGTAASVR